MISKLGESTYSSVKTAAPSLFKQHRLKVKYSIRWIMSQPPRLLMIPRYQSFEYWQPGYWCWCWLLGLSVHIAIMQIRRRIISPQSPQSMFLQIQFSDSPHFANILLPCYLQHLRHSPVKATRHLKEDLKSEKYIKYFKYFPVVNLSSLGWNDYDFHIQPQPHFYS